MLRPTGTLTYGELAGRVAQVAHVLGHAGVEPGDRVLLRMANGASLAAAWLGVQRAGAIAVTTFSMLRTRELDALLADAEPAALIVDPDLAGEVARTRARSDNVVVIDDLDTRTARQPETFVPVIRPRDAIATIIYTADPDSAAPRARVTPPRICSRPPTPTHGTCSAQPAATSSAARRRSRSRTAWARCCFFLFPRRRLRRR